jgi:anti-sigma factor RsiW
MKSRSEDFAPSACGRKEELITYLYGESTPEQSRVFESHLAQCTDCRNEIRGFESVRDKLQAWDVSFAPRVEIEPRRSRLQVFRELAELFPVWARGLAVAGGAAAVLLVTLAAVGSRVSVGSKGVALDFGMASRKTPVPAPPVSPAIPAPPAGNETMLTRSQAEALVNQAVARAEALAREDSRDQIASLEARLVSTHHADLAAVKSQMRAEQKAMLAKVRSSETIREWLFAANENRDGLVGDNEKNQ